MHSIHSARYREFLRRLRRARLDAGFTQAQVAAVLGRPRSFVSKCEAGERRLDLVEAEEFARIYKRRLSYFLPSKSKKTAH